MNAIEGLTPSALWRYFSEISAIPRESKHEEQIRPYLEEQARRLGLDHETDAVGNICVRRPGKGTPVVLQAHMDMVCEKDMGSAHDFRRDPIRLVRDGEWIRAAGTTLGADNGIGVACMLALMESERTDLPPLEFLFTVDEETGMTGANNLAPDFFEGRTLINLDSEEDGIVYIGCAGGLDTILNLPLSREDIPEGLTALRIQVRDLRGGHSGTDIHTGIGNAIRILARCLDAGNHTAFQLADLTGGTKRNAIPREAHATICCAPTRTEDIIRAIHEQEELIRSELQGIDDGMHIAVTKIEPPATMLTKEAANTTLRLLTALPHGVLQISDVGVVTSTNLAITCTRQDDLFIETSQRSFIQSALHAAGDQIKAMGALAGATAEQPGEYPAWKPNRSSPLLALTNRCHEELFGAEAKVLTIHAGLECGILGERIPGMDMVSIGPTIENAHSPSERVHIPAVERHWQLVLRMLEEMAD